MRTDCHLLLNGLLTRIIDEKKCLKTLNATGTIIPTAHLCVSLSLPLFQVASLLSLAFEIPGVRRRETNIDLASSIN